MEKIPVNIQNYIKKGIKDKKLETPKNNKIFSNVKIQSLEVIIYV